MKSRYALPVFFLAVAIFWLSLWLTIDFRYSPELYEEINLPYTQVEGIDSLELIYSDENELRYDSTMYIYYAEQPHITLKIRNLKNPEETIQQIFVRKGGRLILQPKIHQQPEKNVTDNDNFLNDTSSRITEMTLPIHINRLYTRGISLNIYKKTKNQEDEKFELNLPELHIDTEDASIELKDIHATIVNIRNRYDKRNCKDKKTHTYSSARITIEEEAKIDTLFIESIYGHIDLENSAAIKNIHLKTTPETSMDLDRLDIYQRMRWEPLPTPPLPACKDGAEGMTAPPSIKAQ